MFEGPRVRPVVRVDTGHDTSCRDDMRTRGSLFGVIQRTVVLGVVISIAILSAMYCGCCHGVVVIGSFLLTSIFLGTVEASQDGSSPSGILGMTGVSFQDRIIIIIIIIVIVIVIVII